MRKLMFLALGAIVGLSFTACGNKQGQTSVMTDTTLLTVRKSRMSQSMDYVVRMQQ